MTFLFALRTGPQETRSDFIAPLRESQTLIDGLNPAGTGYASHTQSSRASRKAHADTLAARFPGGPIANRLQSAIEMHRSYTGPLPRGPSFPGVEYETFHIPYPIMQDSNNLSLVTIIHSGNLHVVVPGGLEIAGWKELPKQACISGASLRVNVFIASHHGRENGYCADIFQYCNPALVIISDTVKQYESQERNYYAHAFRGVIS